MAINWATRTADFVTDLSTSAGTTIAASKITVLHRDLPGDRGGGTFYWDSDSAADADGNLVVEVAGASGRWIRIVEDSLNVCMFGAKGDGVTDDTAALQAAFNALKNNGSIVVPPGTYLITSNVTIGGVSDVARLNNAKIRFNGKIISNNSSGLIFDHLVFCQVSDICIENITRDWTTECFGVKFHDITNCDISFRDVLRYKYNLFMDCNSNSVAYNTFRGGRIVVGYFDLYVDITVTEANGGGYFNENTFYSTTFQLGSDLKNDPASDPTAQFPTGSASVYMRQVPFAWILNNNRFVSCTFENARNGVILGHMESTGPNGGPWVSNFVFLGCRWENIRDVWLGGSFRQCLFLGGYGLDRFDATRVVLNATDTRGNTWLTGGDEDVSELQDTCLVDEALGAWGFVDGYGKITSKIHNNSMVSTPLLTNKTGRIQRLNKQYEVSNFATINGTYEVGAVVWLTNPVDGQGVIAICTTPGTNEPNPAGLTGSGTIGTNVITAVGTVPNRMNARYILIGGDKYRVGSTKGQTINVIGNLINNYDPGTPITYSNDAAFFFIGNYVPNTGHNLSATDGTVSTGTKKTGAITFISNSIPSSGYPALVGQAVTFNGASAGNNLDRDFSFWVPRQDNGNDLYFQRYTSAGVATGWQKILTDANAGSVTLANFTTNVGNTSTTPNVFSDLYSVNIPANKLAVDGNAVIGEYSGTFAANANDKSLAAFIDGNGAIMSVVPNNGGSWSARIMFMRTGVNTGRASIYMIAEGVTRHTINVSLAGLDYTNPIEFALAGAGGGAANDIVANFGKVKFEA